MVTMTITQVLNVSLSLILNNFDMICGPKSPTTTKYVMHVPIKYPIMHNSTNNFPDEPKIYEAKEYFWKRKENVG